MTKLQLAWEDRMKDLKSRNEQLEADNRKLLSIASEQTDVDNKFQCSLFNI